MRVGAPIGDECSRLVGRALERVLTCGTLQHSRIRSQACGQMGAFVSNSAGESQSHSYVSGATTRAPRVLRVVQTRTPSSPRSGGINSNMLIYVYHRDGGVEHLRSQRQSACCEDEGSAAAGPLRLVRAASLGGRTSHARATHLRWLSAIAQRPVHRRR